MAVTEGGKKCPIVGMIKDHGGGKGGLYHRDGKAVPGVAVSWRCNSCPRSGSIMKVEKLLQRWLYHTY